MDKKYRLCDDAGSGSYASCTLRPLEKEEQKTILCLPETARIIFDHIELTQQELLQRAADIANYLRSDFGVKPGDRIGLMMTANLDVVPSILGIWMAGAAYVPIDPALPDERLYQITRDADLRGVITQYVHSITLGLLSTRLGRELPFLAIDRCELKKTGEAAAEIAAFPDQPAYLIYTSGSTGLPKGVICTFGSLSNLIAAVREPLGLSSGTRHLQFASLSFDASVWEIFPTLFSGGTIVHAIRDELLPGKRMADFLRDRRVTHICLPPSVLGKLSNFAEMLPALRCVVMAGERCPPPLAAHWRRVCRVINAYGPTEATVCATMYDVKGDENPVPIGTELANVRVRIVDASGQDNPVGIPGELWIGGQGVASGYRGMAELTAERFHQAPENEIWYRSGDKAVRKEDGQLVFLGRLDQQVKLRGFRIELEAIEYALHSFPGIAQAAVKIFEEDDDQGLSSGIIVAYYSTAEGHSISPEMLRAQVSSALPDYMVPHYFVEQECLPLMQNGSKVNMQALEAPQEWIRKRSRTQDAAVSGTSEERLCRYFEQAIDALEGSISAEDNFFHAGGDSLGVAQLLTQIEDDFGVALPSHIVYSNPTPKALLPFCLQEKDFNLDARSLRAELLEDAEYDARQLENLPRVENLPKRILLTGGTGFLGIHLVAALASRVEKLYCLVRASDETGAASRLRASATRYGVKIDWGEHICPLAGDITEESLGLSAETYRHLARDGDAIVHAAASISYILPYADASKPNALGTRHILQFATSEQVKALHHISSMSPYGSTGPLLNMPVVDEDFDIDQSLDIICYENGYTRAKWVAEKMIGKAKAAGVPVSIYRPGFIEGNSHTGIGNPDDLFSRFLVGNIQMGMYPDFPLKYWLVVPVDFTASAIAHIVCTQKPGGAYNLLPERHQEPSNNELFAMMEDVFGFPMKRVEPHVWLRELSRLRPDNALFPLVNFLREKVYHNRRSVLEMHYMTSRVHNGRTRAALDSIGLQCPDINTQLLRKYIDHLFTRYIRPGMVLK